MRIKNISHNKVGRFFGFICQFQKLLYSKNTLVYLKYASVLRSPYQNKYNSLKKFSSDIVMIQITLSNVSVRTVINRIVDCLLFLHFFKFRF